MHLFINSSLPHRLPLLALLLTLAACQKADKPDDPLPAVCGECETCVDYPPGNNPLSLGYNNNWGYAKPDKPQLRAHPQCNPDNSDEVLYARTVAGGGAGSGLYMLNLRTKQERRVLPNPLNLGGPVVGDGGVRLGTREWLVFGSTAGHLWRVKTNGDSLTQLTTNRQVSYASPFWSPEGRRIICTQRDGRSDSIVVFSATGQRLEALPVPGQFAAPIAWSPDGNRLVFLLGAGFADPATVPTGLFIYDFRTRQSVRAVSPQALVPGTVGRHAGIDWLVDNRTLLFAGGGGVYSFDTQTQQTTLLHKGCLSRQYLELDVSRDGRTVVVQREDYEVRGTPPALYGTTDLYLMNPDGRNERLALP